MYSIERAESMQAIIEHILGGYDVEYKEDTEKGIVYIHEDEEGKICVELWDDMYRDTIMEVRISHEVNNIVERAEAAYQLMTL